MGPLTPKEEAQKAMEEALVRVVDRLEAWVEQVVFDLQDAGEWERAAKWEEVLIRWRS